MFTRYVTPHCHSRAGGNPFLIPAGPAKGSVANAVVIRRLPSCGLAKTRMFTRYVTPHCHSRAGGNPFLVPAGPAVSYEWVPACAGMTVWVTVGV